MYKDDSADREEEKWSRKKKRYNNNEGRFYPINYSPKKQREKINKENLESFRPAESFQLFS